MSRRSDEGVGTRQIQCLHCRYFFFVPESIWRRPALPMGGYRFVLVSSLFYGIHTCLLLEKHVQDVDALLELALLGRVQIRVQNLRRKLR
jgi:hypothetical protein